MILVDLLVAVVVDAVADVGDPRVHGALLVVAVVGVAGPSVGRRSAGGQGVTGDAVAIAVGVRVPDGGVDDRGLVDLAVAVVVVAVAVLEGAGADGLVGVVAVAAVLAPAGARIGTGPDLVVGVAKAVPVGVGVPGDHRLFGAIGVDVGWRHGALRGDATGDEPHQHDHSASLPHDVSDRRHPATAA